MELQAKTTLTEDVHKALASVVHSTLPLLLADGDNVNEVLGNGTLFTAEGRVFIVTAFHVIKTESEDLGSPNIDFGDVFFPTSLGDRVTLRSLGSVHVWRVDRLDVDVAVLEVLSEGTRRNGSAGSSSR
jgi:hypothetical protein